VGTAGAAGDLGPSRRDTAGRQCRRVAGVPSRRSSGRGEGQAGRRQARHLQERRRRARSRRGARLSIDRTIAVYAHWDVLSPADYDKRIADRATERERQRKLEEATIAFIAPGEPAAEAAVNQQGEETTIVRADGRAGRRAAKWFSYDLAIDPARPLVLVVTFNSDTRRAKAFEVLVEGPSKNAWKQESGPVQLTGRTRTDHIAVFDGNPRLAGAAIDVDIEAGRCSVCGHQAND
jgi:hypothetical protein